MRRPGRWRIRWGRSEQQRGEDRTETVNKFIDVRFAKRFALGTARFEGTIDVFNLLNAKNPSAFSGARFLATGAPNPNFLVPQNYAGDFQNPEQRVGQIGFRFTF